MVTWTEHAGPRRRKPWALRRLPAECSAGAAAAKVGVARLDFGSRGIKALRFRYHASEQYIAGRL